MALAWCARRVRNASRCGGGQRPQPYHCAAFQKRYTTIRLRSPSAATAARSFHATRAPCEHQKMVSAW
eukprot:1212689-Lingulodinium_polyedra.AAC.1